MKINYCLPIIKSEKNEILRIINENIDKYQYFEIWLDYIEDLDTEFINQLTHDLERKLILLFRRQNLEPINITIDKRFEIIARLDNTDIILDLDISQTEELSFIKEHNLNLKKIISYHNYQETPSTNKLNEIIDIINKYHPTILKISTLCQSEDDSLRLLQILLNLKQKSTKYIVSGMGYKGKIIKIFGTLWGNEMIFAPIETKDQSAPGQIVKKDLDTIFEILNT